MWLRLVTRFLLLALVLSSFAFAKSFTDEDLNYLMKVLPGGIVYVWSPHMPYSMKGIRIIQAVGDRLRLPVFLLVDPHANRTLALDAQRIFQLGDKDMRPVGSWTLIQRNITTQFPSVVVFKNGNLRGGTIPGVKSEEHYLKLIERQLQR